MKKNIVIDLVNNKTTADSLMLYDAVRLEVITGIKGLFSVRDDKIPKLIIAWHRFPLLEEPNNWMISEDGSSATLEFVLKSFGIKDSFVHIPAKGFRLFEFNIIIPKNNVAVASARINVQNNTLEGIPFSQQDRDKLDSIDLTNYYTKVEVDNKFASFDPGTGGAVYTFTKPLNVDTNNVVSIDLTEYAKLTDLPNIPKNLSSFTNDTGFITKSALNGYATEYFVTSRGYITAADIPDIPTIPTNISSFFNDAGYITIKDVPSVDLTPYALKSELFSRKFADITDTPNTLDGYGIKDASINGRTITLGSNSITVPESSGGSGDYTLTKEAVDGVIGASSTGSTTKFYNEQGAFTEVDMSGYLPLSGGSLTGTLNVGVIQADNLLSIGAGDYGGEQPSTMYLGTNGSSISSRFGISIRSSHGYVDLYSAIGVRINDVKAATVNDISTHNTAADAHTDLFALKVDAETYNTDTTAINTALEEKVDTETYNTAITAINTTLDGKENTGVAQGLVDTHATITASSDTLGHIKVDNETITVDKNGVATAHAVGHNIFDIFYSMSSKAPAGAMDLSLGTLIASCDTVFPDFWSECVARKAEGSIRTITEEEWQAEVTANGSCGAFVVDEDVKSVRLPKITNMIQPGDVGVFTAAGLPNITGDLKLRPNTAGLNTFFGFDGAFNMGSETAMSAAAFSINTGAGKTYIPITFNASRSSSIYGNSTTVQPPTVGAKLYIQVFTSAVPASMAQAGEFINMLETKADKTELDLLQPAGTIIAFAGNSTPAGYLICNGAAVNRTTYAKLFAIIGTTYGAGDGSTTFNLPNLTDKFIMGSGTAGTIKAAGLPNITGSFGGSDGIYPGSFSSGAFTVSGSGASLNNSTNRYHNTATFDASKSNSIYGNSTTVQPPALTMRFYIKF